MNRCELFPTSAVSAVVAAMLGLLAAGCSSGGGASPADAGTHDASHEAAPKHDAAPKRDAGISDALSLDGWTVPSGCNPLAVTTECLLPYPSDLMTRVDTSTPTGLRLALPPNALTVPDAAIPIDMTPFNLGDGAPTSEPILVHFGVDVGSSFLWDETQTASSLLATSPIALMNESTGERVPFLSEMDVNQPTVTGRHALIIRPLTPLAFGTRYVVVLSSSIRDTSGHPLPDSKGFVALRDHIPTGVAALEAVRPHFEELFTFLASHGYPRDTLQLAWDYTTSSSASVTGPIAAMRQEVFHAATLAGPQLVDGGLVGADAGVDASVDAGTNTITYAIRSVGTAQYLTGGTVVEGEFTPPNYLQADNTILYSPAMVPALQTAIPAPSYPFTMVIPNLAATETLALMVIGHGAGSNGRAFLTTTPYGPMMQPLAQQLGAVLVATDWIGLSSGDELLVAGEILNNLNHVGVLTGRMLQGLVNNLSLIELSVGALSADPRVRLSMAQPLIDPTRVYYYGLSLGGVEGSSLISVSRHITRGVMVVPGAAWTTIGGRSYDFSALFGLVKINYPDPLFQQEFFTLIQADFDPSDPINLATLFSTSPLPDAPASRTVLLEEGIDDCVMPNLTTEMLARTYASVSLVTPDLVPIFGVPTAASPTTGSALSQFKLTSDVATYVPPTTDTPATTNNQVHNDLAGEPQALAEAALFLGSGTIAQDCDGGPCVLP